MPPADTLSRDIAHLMAAIDAGDDTALPALADALEEAGSPMAEGLREAVTTAAVSPAGPAPYSWHALASVARGRTVGERLLATLPEDWHDRMRARHGNVANWSGYPTRSAAYLALAEALTPKEATYAR